MRSEVRSSPNAFAVCRACIGWRPLRRTRSCRLRRCLLAPHGGTPGRSVWTVLAQYASKSDDKRPTLSELRCMAYLALIAGANGLGIYAWDDRFPDKATGWTTRAHEEDVKILRATIQEFKGLERILILPNSGRKVPFEPPNLALHASVKESSGRTYVLVARNSRRPEQAILSIDGANDGPAACLADGSTRQRLTVARGKASLRIPALGAAVHELAVRPQGAR